MLIASAEAKGGAIICGGRTYKSLVKLETVDPEAQYPLRDLLRSTVEEENERMNEATPATALRYFIGLYHANTVI